MGEVQGDAVRFTVAPRDVPAVKAARRLHLSLTQFEKLKDELFGRGFPHPDPTTGMYDLVKIDKWMDDRGGATDLDRPLDASEALARRQRRLEKGHG